LALLQSQAIQEAAEAAQAAQAAQAALVETLAVPADFLQDLIEARWNAEKARCDAEYRAQLQEVKKLRRV
jgi:hypothetical protein